MREIYLDNLATTRVYPEVLEAVRHAMEEDYGNTSSLHQKGLDAERCIRQARDTLARLLKVQEKELIFTSGGTESDNLALIGAAMANQRAGKHLITSAVEHAAVGAAMRFLEEQGFELTVLPVDQYGFVSPEGLRQAIREDTILVSVMYVNNEIGTVEPVAELAKAVHEARPEILFHADAIQAFGKYRIYPKKLGIDMLSVSGHKIHGPKGVGFLYVDSRVKIRPILYGGGHQNGMRSGTENVPGVSGMALAAEIAYRDLDEKTARMRALKQKFTEGVKQIEGCRINGPEGEGGAPHIVSVSVEGVRAEVLLHALEEKGIFVSAGSACSSNKPAVSATLKAIGLPRELLDSTLRFSFCEYTTEEEIEETLLALKELLPRLRLFRRK